MSFVMNEKLNRFVLCDPDKCMGCYTCMSACYESARKRGKVATARLQVVHSESGCMPNQCRHCEDAPCARVCPTGAIKMGSGKVELHEELCIGCKMCVMVCPYGAVMPEAELMPSVNYLYEDNIDKAIEVAVGQRTVAVKCDLCEGREDGPACVSACPAKALTYYTPDLIESGSVPDKAQNSIHKLVSIFKKDTAGNKFCENKLEVK